MAITTTIVITIVTIAIIKTIITNRNK